MYNKKPGQMCEKTGISYSSFIDLLSVIWSGDWNDCIQSKEANDSVLFKDFTKGDLGKIVFLIFLTDNFLLHMNVII